MNKPDYEHKIIENFASNKVRRISRPAVLFATDCTTFLLTVIVALLAATLFRYYTIGYYGFPASVDAGRILIVFSIAFMILIFRSVFLGHYTQFRPFWIELKEVIKTVGMIAAFDAFILFAIGVHFSRLWFGFFLVFSCISIPYARHRAKQWMISRALWYQPTFIVGTGTNARRTAKALQSDASLGHEIFGFIDLRDRNVRNKRIDDIPVYADIEIAQAHIDTAATLIFAFETTADLNEHRELLDQALAESIHLAIVPPSMKLPLYGATVVGIFRHDTALIKLQNRLADPTAQFIKRAVDIVLGLFLLIIFSPVFAFLAITICRDGGPVFYNHTRLGKNGKIFKCHKFRTMKTDSEHLLRDYLKENPDANSDWLLKRKLKKDPRVTQIGQYLRRTSVDELPQLVNVIKGEMSLVGPRPIVTDEVPHYGSLISYYLNMTPGMTGLWQVSGRTDTSYEERVKLDVWYCKNWTLWNDVVVLLKTFNTLVSRHGAY